MLWAEVVFDRPLQLLNALKRSTSDSTFGDLGEEPLDLVEPRRTGRGEVRDVLRMPGEPLPDHRVLVSPVVVHHHMDARTRLTLVRGVDVVQKGNELLVPMTSVALPDDRARGHAEALNRDVVPWRT